MLNLESSRGVTSCDGVTRRDFLRVGSLAVGLSLTKLTQLQALDGAGNSNEKSCIQLFLVGGPSQLDTWDLKPNAPSEIRGPFRPIRTNVSGIEICEHFPRMAQRADRYAILRSLHHKEAPIHETGQQLLQSGRLARGGVEWPHCGAVVSQSNPSARDVPSWVVLPNQIQNTGVNVGHGQTSGFLGAAHEPFIPDQSVRQALGTRDPMLHESLVEAADCAHRNVDAVAKEQSPTSAQGAALDQVYGPQAKRAFNLAAEPDSVRERYGWNTFGQSCLLARRLVQHGVRLATVNMFDTVFNTITWDCHANGSDLNSTLDDYRDLLCPMFDQAYSALLDDLVQMGMLDDTLVLGMGEFGRTPRLNARNGRDHWAGVWSMLLAGGGIQGGQIIGSSNALGEEPKDRPTVPAEIVATVYQSLGVDPNRMLADAQGHMVPLVDAKAIV